MYVKIINLEGKKKLINVYKIKIHDFVFCLT